MITRPSILARQLLKPGRCGVGDLIAEQVLDYLKHGTVRGAVEHARGEWELLAAMGPYISLGEKFGSF